MFYNITMLVWIWLIIHSLQVPSVWVTSAPFTCLSSSGVHGLLQGEGAHCSSGRGCAPKLWLQAAGVAAGSGTGSLCGVAVAAPGAWHEGPGPEADWITGALRSRWQHGITPQQPVWRLYFDKCTYFIIIYILKTSGIWWLLKINTLADFLHLVSISERPWRTFERAWD